MSQQYHGKMHIYDGKITSNLTLKPNEKYSWTVTLPENAWFHFVMPEDVEGGPTVLTYKIDGSAKTSVYTHASATLGSKPIASYCEHVLTEGIWITNSKGTHSITIENTGGNTVFIRELWQRTAIASGEPPVNGSTSQKIGYTMLGAGIGIVSTLSLTELAKRKKKL